MRIKVVYPPQGTPVPSHVYYPGRNVFDPQIMQPPVMSESTTKDPRDYYCCGECGELTSDPQDHQCLD